MVREVGQLHAGRRQPVVRLKLGWPWLWAGLALGWLALGGLWEGWAGLPLPGVEARP